MRRREFIGVLGGSAAWPLAGHAQQSERMRRIGVLIAFPKNDPNTQAYVAAFVQSLGRLGWAEGKNIRIDYRFAAGDPALFKSYAAELVGLMPDAILATTTPGVAALREQTRTIPIVFVGDPVGQGFVQSLARPGGNVTGLLLRHSLDGKMAAIAQGGRAGSDAGHCHIQPGYHALRIFQP